MKKNCIKLVIVFLILITLILLYLLTKTKKEIRFLEDEFALKLPKETNVIFSDNTHGSLGDGVSLYIYQISSKDMDDLIKQRVIKNWNKLPVDGKLSVGLYEKVKGLSNEKIAKYMNITSRKGYYFVKNRYNIPLKGYEFQDISYSNIVIGIIDLEKDEIYYVTLDM